MRGCGKRWGSCDCEACLYAPSHRIIACSSCRADLVSRPFAPYTLYTNPPSHPSLPSTLFRPHRQTNRHSPGFGLTPRSPPSTRLAHVLTATLAVLTHLHIRHTAFLSASAGSLYLLNTLSSPLLRPFLHPKRPYAAFLVPWVHPTYSKCGLLGAATKLPESWIGGFGDVQRWMVKRVGPVLSLIHI